MASEATTRKDRIDPRLRSAGWHVASFGPHGGTNADPLFERRSQSVSRTVDLTI